MSVLYFGTLATDILAETFRHNRRFDTWTFWPAYLGAYFLHGGVTALGHFGYFGSMGTLQDMDRLGKGVFHHLGIMVYVLYD